MLQDKLWYSFQKYSVIDHFSSRKGNLHLCWCDVKCHVFPRPHTFILSWLWPASHFRQYIWASSLYPGAHQYIQLYYDTEYYNLKDIVPWTLYICTCVKWTFIHCEWETHTHNLWWAMMLNGCVNFETSYGVKIGT